MSMADSDIDLFLSETNALDSSFYIEPPLSCFHNDILTNTIAISPSKKSTHTKTLPSEYNQMPSFIASPSHHQACPKTNLVDDTSFGIAVPFEITEQTPHAFVNESFHVIPKEPPSYFQSFLIDPKEQLPSVNLLRQHLPSHPENQAPQGYLASQNILLHGKEQPTHSSYYPQMNTYVKHQLSGQFLPPPYINFQAQSSQLPYRTFAMSSNLADAMSDLLSHDREAVLSFLAGKVRLGPDVTEIYKCNECFVQFPNAQAFGGHMSFHSKNKRTEEHNSKRSKYDIQASSSISSRKRMKRKANVSTEEGSRMKKISEGMKLAEKERVQNEHDRDVLGKIRCGSVEKANTEVLVEDKTSIKI